MSESLSELHLSYCWKPAGYLLPFQPKAIQPVDGFTVTLSFLPECITPRTDQADQKVEEAETPASKSNMKQKFGIIVIQINYRLSEQAH